jgi:predicted ArsR family transcriptional regulator
VARGQREKSGLRRFAAGGPEAKKARGERVGRIPFGYQLGADGRTLEPHADEQRALGMLRELRAAGHTLRAVADELNRQGVRTRSGAAWKHQYVANLAAAA